MRNIFKKFLALFMLLPLVGAVLSIYSPVQNVGAVSDNVCPEGNGWVKDNWGEGESSNEYTATQGTIDQVCIKGGQRKEFYTNDGVDDCWGVDFKNGDTKVRIYESHCDGAGRGEPDISHISYHVVPNLTPTPTPTPTPQDVCTNIQGVQTDLP